MSFNRYGDPQEWRKKRRKKKKIEGKEKNEGALKECCKFRIKKDNGKKPIY